MEKNSEMTFQRYLSNAFEKRCLKNPSYSLRAFARDLGVPPTNLSNALNGTRGFSEKTLDQMSKKLSLNSEEAQLLKALSQREFSKSKKIKSEAIEKIKSALLYQLKLADEKLSLISDWYHLAIMALTETKDFHSDHAWIAERLGLHIKIVDQAMERLLAVGALKKENGHYISIGNFFIDPKGIPSRSVRDFHHQILQKADEALEMQDLENRDFSSVLFNLDKSKMTQAKNKLKKFREEFIQEFSADETTSAKNQEVYSMAFQLFQITKIRNNLNKGK